MSELRDAIKSLAEKYENVGEALTKQKEVINSLVSELKEVADHVGSLEEKKS